MIEIFWSIVIILIRTVPIGVEFIFFDKKLMMNIYSLVYYLR